jgi:uncharacterized protein
MNTGWEAVPRKQVKIDNGFWTKWRTLVGDVTLFHQYDQLKQQGQIDALHLDKKLHRGRRESENWYWGGSIFWDSDLGKWLEAASAQLEQKSDARLEALVDDLISRVEKAQQADGYLNTHILTWRPSNRFKNLRDLHELYSAGHLIEGAVVHYEATGKTTLLNFAKRFADYLCTMFGSGANQIPAYCGHPEIELALIRLFRVTGEQKYLELSRFFVEQRGQKPIYFEHEAVERLDSQPFRPNHPVSPYAYMQAHLPIREQTEVLGHSVRAMYLYCAVADLAKEFGDQSLVDISKAFWENLCTRKLYVTGGMGSSAENEGFTEDYDLPNEKAYAESCAGIGLFFWAHRMIHIDPDSRYADMMERSLYNGILSGIGFNGKTFFYDNPLSSDGTHHRIEWPWWCPCCPPNLARLITSLSGYLYSSSVNEIVVHQYISSEASLDLGGLKVGLKMTSGFPFDGKVSLTINPERSASFSLVLRVPSWAKNATYSVNGEPVSVALKTGYASIQREWKANDVVTVDYTMSVERIHAHPKVKANRGRIALSRGPIVYCIEESDNGPELESLIISESTDFRSALEDNLLDGVVTLTGEGWRESGDTNTLYTTEPVEREKVEIKAVPYFAWDNRVPGEMRVWIRSAD